MRVYRTFNEARRFARSLKLKSRAGWDEIIEAEKHPEDIPKAPDAYYNRRGYWNSWGDFLGTGNIQPGQRKFWSYEKAREFVRKLGLKDTDAWYAYCKSGKKPIGLPSLPSRTYKKEWKGWGDYLGTGRIANQDKEYLSPIEAKIEARKYQKKLGIKTQKDWEIAYKSGKIPSTLPASLWNTYGRQRRKRK